MEEWDWKTFFIFLLLGWRLVYLRKERKRSQKSLWLFSVFQVGFGLMFAYAKARSRLIFCFDVNVYICDIFGIVNGLFKKKVYHDLDHVEKCGFLHGVQHVLNNIFEVYLDIANFWPFFLYFMGIFGKQKIQVVENGT